MATVQQVSTAKSTPWFKYVATNLTVDGTYISTLPALSTTKPTDKFIPTIAPNGARFTGIEIMPFGGDAADETVVFVLNQINTITDWGVDGSVNYDFVYGLTVQYSIRPISVITGTLKEQAAADGVAGGYMGTADFLCDAVSVAPTAYGTALDAYAITGVGVSFGSDGLGASAIFGDFGPADFLQLGYDNTTGTGAFGNALIKLFGPTYTT